jgi:hypothetical protein
VSSRNASASIPIICVSHARPRAPAGAHGALDAAHGEYRPLGRHDDHPRRERVPHADRGADPEAAALAPHYQLEISRPRTLDELAVLVERAQSSGSSDGDAAGAALAQLIKNLIGVTAQVRVLPPGGIERSLGKARRVVDKRVL